MYEYFEDKLQEVNKKKPYNNEKATFWPTSSLSQSENRNLTNMKRDVTETFHSWMELRGQRFNVETVVDEMHLHYLILPSHIIGNITFGLTNIYEKGS